MTQEPWAEGWEARVSGLIGHEIRKARRARGWKLKDLAKASGFSVQYLSEIERGLGGLPFRTFLRLTRLLGLNWLELIDAQGRAKEGERHPSSSLDGSPWPVLLGVTFLYETPPAFLAARASD